MCSFLLPGGQKGEETRDDDGAGGSKRKREKSGGPCTQQVLTRFLVGRGQANQKGRKDIVEGQQS